MPCPYEYQDEAAGIGLGLQPREAVAPADWMRCYFRHVRAIDRLSTQMVDEISPGPSYLYDYYEDWRSRRSNADFWVRRERIFLRNPASLEQPENLLAPFEFIAKHGFRLSGQAEEQIEQAAARVGDRAGELPDLWERLKKILTPPHAADAMRAMRRTGVLNHLIPEFRAIDSAGDSRLLPPLHRGRAHLHDHRECPSPARAERGLGTRLSRHSGHARTAGPVVPLAAAARRRQGVARGRSRNRQFASCREGRGAMKLDPEEAATARFLVGGHLEMSATMQRRNVFDPATIRIFADKMGTLERLKMLCLLTLTDIRSVNPEALTPWKAGALWHLYVRASNYLVDSVDEKRIRASGEEKAQVERVLPFLGAAADPQALAAFLEGIPLRYLASHSPDQVAEDFRMAQKLNGGGGVEVRLTKRNQFFEMTLVTGDRPMLFATIAGTLFAWGMSVMKADAYGNQAGIALDTFEFVDLHGTLEMNPSEAERFKETLRNVLERAGESGIDAGAALAISGRRGDEGDRSHAIAFR